MKKYHKILISLVMCIVIMINSAIYSSYANSEISKEKGVNQDIVDAIVVQPGSIVTTNNIVGQYKWRIETGHGFAAERGNDLIDKIKGKNTRIVGDNCEKNGPDRQIINRDGTRVNIQDKYYSTASKGINSCFDETTGMFRYLNEDGTPMQIEVPKDQYDDAVKCMEEKIRAGKVKGVTDPEKAKELVRKGHLSYKQAKNLAKAGTIESLSYDAVHGIVSGGVTFGISTLINYAIGRINGNDRTKAIKDASIDGLKTGGLVFASSVIAAQLGKTELLDVFKPATDKLVNFLGKYFQEIIVKTTGETLAADVANQASKILRGQIVANIVTTVVFTVPDLVNTFRGRISKTQFVKNFSVTAISIATGTLGYFLGSVAGIPGSIAGSLILGGAGGWVADKIGDLIASDDAEEMYEIVSNVYVSLCEDYMISESEGDKIAIELSKKMNDDFFKDMYQSDDRELFISDIMTPLFEEVVVLRPVITEPNELELRAALKEELIGIVLIH